MLSFKPTDVLGVSGELIPESAYHQQVEPAQTHPAAPNGDTPFSRRLDILDSQRDMGSLQRFLHEEGDRNELTALSTRMHGRCRTPNPVDSSIPSLAMMWPGSGGAYMLPKHERNDP